MTMLGEISTASDIPWLSVSLNQQQVMVGKQQIVKFQDFLLLDLISFAVLY